MLILLSIACMSVIITSFVDLPTWLNRKPFNCVVCLAYWVAVFFQLVTFQPILEVVFYPFAVSYLAYMLKKLLHI